MTQQGGSPAASLYSGTAAGLIEFLDYARDKGILARKTAEAYKSASSLVLSIDGEGWQASEVRSLDLEDQVSRFIRLRGHKASPRTLGDYRRRVGAAIAMYRDFLDNPTGFRRSSARAKPAPTRRTAPKPAPAEPQPAGVSRQAALPATAELVTYPFPLRSGGMAYLQLPRELTRGDVSRLSAFLASLATDDPSQSRST